MSLFLSKYFSFRQPLLCEQVRLCMYFPLVMFKAGNFETEPYQSELIGIIKYYQI